MTSRSLAIVALYWVGHTVWAQELPPVYVYHEPTVGGYAYFDVSKRAEPTVSDLRMCEVLVRELRKRDVAASLVDAKGWVELCHARKRCIVVDICQYAHEMVYQRQDERATTVGRQEENLPGT